MGQSHAPLLVGVLWALVIVSCIFLCLRVHCRYTRSRGLWWDDGALIFAWVCLCIDACCISANTSKGFGRHSIDIDPIDLPYISLLGNFSGVSCVLAAIFSKISFALTLLRISESRIRALLWFVIVSVSLFLGGSILIQWIQCTPLKKNWDLAVKGTCWNPQIFVVYGIATGAYGGCMDMLLALLPWKVIWKLQMKEKEKLGVGIAMSMGVFAGLIAIIKSVYIPEIVNPDFSFVGVKIILWGAAESSVCIIAASIPILRVLLKHTSGKYFKSSNYGGEIGGFPLSNGPRSRTTTAITTGGQIMLSSVQSATKKPDAHPSDGEILNSDSSLSVPQGGIVQSTEIAVEYHYGNDLDSHEEFGFELRKVGVS